MVAIVTGKGTGLERSSAWVLGARGQLGSAPLGRDGEGVYVNAANGNLVITRQDEFLIGLGPDSGTGLAYNSQGNLSDDNGDNWRPTPSKCLWWAGGLNVAGATVTRRDWDGSEVVFTYDVPLGKYVSKEGSGAYDTIVYTDRFHWIDGDTQVNEYYAGTDGYKITTRTDADGNKLTYTYTGGNLRVTTEKGDYTELVYSGTLLQQLTTYAPGPTPTLTRVFYEYDGSNRLSTVRVNLDPTDNSMLAGANYVTTYTYDDASKRVASIAQQDGSLVQFTYALVGADYRIASYTQTVAAGVTRTTSFDYSVPGRTTVTDPAGQKTILWYNSSNELTQISYPPEDNFTTPRVVRFSYDGDGDVMSATLGPGNVITYNHDARGNLILERDGAGNTITRTYSDPKNELLTETRYLAPDPDGGGGDQPGTPQTTRWVYDDSTNLRFVVSAEGLVTEYQYETNPGALGFGQQEIAIENIAHAYVLDGLGPEDLISLATLTAWMANVTDKSTTRRTETSYDYRGAVATVTSYSKLLSSGEFDTSSELSRTTYTYDTYGSLLTRTVHGSAASEVFVHDGLGRNIIATDFNGAVTRTSFLDSLGQTMLTHANGLSEVSTYNRAGELIASSQSSAGANLVDLTGWPGDPGAVPGGQATVPGWMNPSHYTDEAQWAATTGPDGLKVVAIRSGQPDATAEGGGNYSNEMTIDGTKAYEFTYFFKLNALDKHEIYFGLSGAVPAYVETLSDGSDNGNPIFWYATTSMQAANFQVDKWYKVVGYVLPQGTPTSSTPSGGVYDVATGQKVLDVHKNFRWNPDRPGNTVHTRLFNYNGQTSQDYWTYFYQPEVRQVSTASVIGPDAATSLYRYDALGRLRMTVDPTGRRNYLMYDSVGRKAADIDADGSVIEYRYDGSDNLTSTTRYATRISVGALVDGNGNPTNIKFDLLRPAQDSANDQWTFQVYDGAQRLIQTIDGSGATTIFTYDGASRLTSTKSYANRLSASTLAFLKGEAIIPNLWLNPANGTLWSSSNLTRTATGTTIEGAPAYQFSVLTGGAWQGFSSGSFSAAAGETVSFTISIKAVGSVTSETLGIFTQAGSSWGADSEGAATIVSGPGTISQIGGGLFNVTGLSTSQATRVTITRKIPQNDAAQAYFYLKTADFTQVAAGDSVIAAAPIYVRTHSTTVNLPAADAANDRTTRNFYDKDGRLIATLDGAGGLSELVYDKGGRTIRELGYAKAAASDLWAAGTLAALRTSAGTTTHDRRVDHVYDARGFERFTIDATARPIEMVYDAGGRIIRTIAYAGSIAPAASYSLASVTAQLDGTVLGTSADNRITRSVYDAAGRLIFGIDAAGAVSAFAYDNVGNVTRQTRYATAYTVAGDPSLATMQSWAAGQAGHASNRISRNVHDVRGRIAYTVDAEGYVTEHQYDRAGRVTGEISYVGIYAVSDGVTKESLAALIGPLPATAVVTTHAYDSDGLLSDTVDATGAVTHFTYDAFGQVIDTTIAHGTADASTTHRAYNALGQVVSETRAYGTSIAATTGFSYDALGNLTDVTDPRNHVTTRTYDRLGRMLSVSVPVDAILANNLVTASEYDAFGQVVKVTDARGKSSFTYYDTPGRYMLQSDAEGFVTKTTYTIFGEVHQVTRYAERGALTPAPTVETRPTIVINALNDATTTFSYDKMSRLKSVTDAQNHVESYSYDAFGDRFQTVNKTNGVTQHIFDRLGRMRYEWVDTAAHRPDGSVQATGFYKTILEYDFRGNVTRKVEAYGLTERRDTHYAYDKNGRLTLSYMLPLDTIGTDLLTVSSVWPEERFTYNLRGELFQSVDLGGGKTISYYDALGRKTDEVGPTGTLSHWTYDANGNVSAAKVYGDPVAVPALPTHPRPDPVNTANYRETSHVYDRADRLTTTTVAGLRLGVYNGSAYSTYVEAVTTSRSYDKAGNVILDYDGVGYAVRSYCDALGRKVAEVDREDFLTIWTRDANGNAALETRYATRVASPPAENATVGELVALAGGGDPGADRTTEFEYDRNGRRTREIRLGVAAATASGPLATTIQGATIQYHYNGLGLVSRKTEANDTFTDFEYDNSGRLIRITEAAFTDHEGASVRPTTESFYDGLGNVVRTEVNRQSGAGADDRVTRYSYGAGGRLLSTTDAVNFTRTFGYDVAGRVVKESWQRAKSDGATLVTEAIGYRYDLAGRLITQAAATWNGSAWQFGEATRIRYNAYGEVTGRGVTGSPNDAAVYQEEFRYDDGGRMWRSTGEDGTVKLTIHNRNGAVTLAIASTGTDLSADSIDQALARLTNNGANTVGAAVVAGVAATIFVYNRRGELAETREPFRELSANGAGGFNMATLITGRAYNAFGEVVGETDARGYATDFAYNAMGRLIEKKSPSVDWTSVTGATASARPTETYFYDVSGRLVGLRDANGSETWRELLAGTGHGGGEALVTAEIHSDSGVFRTWYDSFRDARLIRNELNPSATPTYSAASDERRSYDRMSRLVTVEQRGGLLTDSYAYDGPGRRTRHWNSFLGAGNVEKTDYDVQGRVTDTVAFGGDTTHTDHVWSSAIVNAGLTGAGVAIGGWIATTTYINGKSLVETSDLFGHAIARTDLGEHDFTYGYDLGGRLTGEAGPSGYSKSFSWLNSGRLYQLVDTAGTGMNAVTAKYGYDAAGNRIYEGYSGLVYSFNFPSGTTSATLTLQNATIAYDALGRITSFTDRDAGGATRITVTNEYDKNGNVRRTSSTFPNLAAGSGSVSQDKWYQYDNMNRMVLVDGQLSGGQIVRGAWGANVAYDAAGRRISQTKDAGITGWSFTWIWFPGHGPGSQYGTEYPEEGVNGNYGHVAYAFSGERREEYEYRPDGALAKVRFAETGYTDNENGSVTSTGVIGTGVLRAEYARDALGRITNYSEYGPPDGYGYTGVSHNRYSIVYDSRGNITSESVSQLKVEGPTSNSYVTNTVNSYTGDGRLSWTSADQHKNGHDEGQYGLPDTRMDYSYAWYDGARVATTTYDFDTANSGTNWVSTYHYDGAGRLASVGIADGRPRTVSFAYTPEGQVLHRKERSAATVTYANPEDQRYFVNGAQFGEITNNGNNDPSFADYAANLNYIRNWTPNPQSAPFRWNTTTGIMRGSFGGAGYDPVNPYGDGAQSTGSSYIVRGGETLQSIAAGLWGDAALWYMIAQANGLSGGEQLIAGQALHIPDRVTNIHNNASTFEVYDPNHALGDLSPTSAKPARKKGGCGMMGQIIVSVIAIVVVAVVTAIAGPIASAVARVALAIGANVFAQGVGVATGLQDKFSWKSVAIAALTAGIGEGVGQLMPQAIQGSKFLADAARGAATNALTQGVSVATGLQDKFSWAGVAAAGVVSGVGGGVMRGLASQGWVGPEVPAWKNAVANTISSHASALAGAAARSLLTGTDFGDNIIAVLPDVIASTIGNAIAFGVQGSGSRGVAEEAGPQLDYDPSVFAPTGHLAGDPGIVVSGRRNPNASDAEYETLQLAQEAEYAARYEAEDRAAAAVAAQTAELRPLAIRDWSRTRREWSDRLNGYNEAVQLDPTVYANDAQTREALRLDYENVERLEALENAALRQESRDVVRVLLDSGSRSPTPVGAGINVARVVIGVNDGDIPTEDAIPQLLPLRLRGSPGGGTVPHGFASREAFVRFGGDLRSGLRRAGYDDVEPLLQGSAVTGRSYKTGRAFDEGRLSDFDIALASPTLLQRARDLGIRARSGGARTGPLSSRDVARLGLRDVQMSLSQQANRPVRFMIFDSAQLAASRAPSVWIPGR